MNAVMLAAQTSAMPNRTHLKSEAMMKLTTAIQPIEAAPPIWAPKPAMEEY